LIIAPPDRIATLYLLIEVEKRLYMAIALIKNGTFARQVYELLEFLADKIFGAKSM